MSSDRLAPRKFRARSKTFFLTFAQCDETKEAAAKRIAEREVDLDWYIVASEAHADGNPHLHVVLRYKAELSTNDQKRFNYIGQKQANIVRPRDIKATVAYVTKGGDYQAEGIDVPAFLEAAKSKKSTAHTIAATSLLNGTTIEALLAENPGYVLNNLRKLKEFSAYLTEIEVAKQARSLKPFTLKITTVSDVKEIKIGFPRESGDKHYWIYGPTAVGKTTRVLDPLRNHGSGFAIPYNNDYNGYNDEYQFLYCDEFRGQLTSFCLNQLCDGGLMKLNTKGGTVVKRKNLPIVVISNFPPSEVYKDATVISTVERRFNIIHLEARFESKIEDLEPSPDPSTSTQDSQDGSTQPWSV